MTCPGPADGKALVVGSIGRQVNQVTVDPATAAWARVSLGRMLVTP